ncbi:MAG: hypothetical protein P8X42_08020 [Calditrichaceae bacterium]
MSNTSGRGSVIFKILIIIFALGLIAVILIPGKIWNEEAYEKRTAEDNMTSIYEAINFYNHKTGHFTTDPQQILSVVRSDSSILIQQKVVNHTGQLTSLIDSYLKDDYISSIQDIYQNLDQIIDDLEINRRHFEAVDQYFVDESEAIVMDLKNVKSSPKYETYMTAAMYLDSLKELRRDLSDYSLQVGASTAAGITDTLKTLLPEIDVEGIQTLWAPVSERISGFVTRVIRSEDLTQLTSVGDRVQEFRETIISAFEDLNVMNIQQHIDKVNQISTRLDELYNDFLRDFIATSKPALYKLSDADSMIIHLTEDNFYSPVTGEMYKIFVMDDSSAIKVESPVLLKELREKAKPIAGEIKSLPLIPAFSAYFDTLDMIKNKAQFTRKAVKRNTDIFVKYKEIEEVVNKISEISVGTAFSDMKKFANDIPTEESYSKIKNQLKDALQGGRIFLQAYNQQNFGNLDSLQKNLVQLMEQFNDLLDEVRRLPKGVEKYDAEFDMLNQLLSKIKSANVVSQLEKINKELENTLIFAAEGVNEPVYLIFNKSIKNLGYIYKGNKSWEEKDK